MSELQDIEVECLKLKKAINDNHKLAQKAAADAVDRAILTGELLGKWKELLPHGRFEPFTESHFEGSLRTAQIYMQAAKGLREVPKAQLTALLADDYSLEGIIKRVKKDSGKDGDSGTKPNGADRRPPRSGKDKPAVSKDYGKCPNCGGKKWVEDFAQDDAFGPIVANCAKCGHPHGEPAGDRDEDVVDTQRLKTVKTVEALMRAFDDLNTLMAKPAHVEAIASCKFLLKTARAWK